MGKKSLEPQINLEARYLCEELNKSKGSPKHVQETLNKATSNTISQLEYCRRYDYNDNEYHRVLGAMFAAVTATSSKDPARIFPILLKSPWYTELRRSNTTVHNFHFSNLDSHRNSFQVGNIRDVTDAFLAESISKKVTSNEFCHILREFYTAGTETVSTALSWTLLFLAVFPDVQKKVCLRKLKYFISKLLLTGVG